MLILFEMKKSANNKLVRTPLKAAFFLYKISFPSWASLFLMEFAIKRRKTNIFGLLSDKLV